MTEQGWYADPSLLGSEPVSPLPYEIDEMFWDFLVKTNGWARIEPQRSIPHEYVFENPSEGSPVKTRLGLTEDDFYSWPNDAYSIRTTVVDRTLTDGEAIIGKF